MIQSKLHLLRSALVAFSVVGLQCANAFTHQSVALNGVLGGKAGLSPSVTHGQTPQAQAFHRRGIPLIPSSPSPKQNPRRKNIQALRISLSPDDDITIGTFIIFCACFPYVLALFFPETMNKTFFLDVYKSQEQLGSEGKDTNYGQRAEIIWKCMYTTLGLSITTVGFLEAYNKTGLTAEDLLRDNFVLWALFYTAATWKIWYEATDLDIIAREDRTFFQLWHVIVAGVLYYSVFVGETAPLLDGILGK